MWLRVVLNGHLYQRINMADVPNYKVTCPKCGNEFELPLDFLIE